jgi:hypothetical protein
LWVSQPARSPGIRALYIDGIPSATQVINQGNIRDVNHHMKEFPANLLMALAWFSDPSNAAPEWQAKSVMGRLTETTEFPIHPSLQHRIQAADRSWRLSGRIHSGRSRLVRLSW